MLIKNNYSESTFLRQKRHISIALWVIYFCFATSTALIFQKLLLPLIPSMHAGGGLMVNDSVYFDSVASKLAESIRDNGWGSWKLFPAVGAPGNVAILGALYAIFGHDPTVIIPVNAALHAFGGILIFFIALELAIRPKLGGYAGIVAGTFFVIFPSTISWYGQMHKDSFAIAGMLLVLLVWIKAIKNPFNNITWCWLTIGNVAGIALVGIVRPYSIKLLLVASIIILIAIAIVAVIHRKNSSQRKIAAFFLFVFITCGLGNRLLTHAEAADSLQMGETYKAWKGDRNWDWENSSWAPDAIEKYIEIAARTRAGLIAYGIGLKAGSMIDENVLPHNIIEVISYIPRALHIATLAPFPSTWFEKLTIIRMVAAAEMFVYYLCIPGIFFAAYFNRSPAVLMALFFSLFFLSIYGFTQANIGTLYRYRYAFTSILLLLGVIGWFSWFNKIGYLDKLTNWAKSKDQASYIQSCCGPENQEKLSNRKAAFNSGFIVLCLTLVGFIGFFLRDILMARYFGLGEKLDNFFIALLIPMFIVTILCMPLGAAFTTAYLSIKEKSTELTSKFIGNISFWVSTASLLICLILYFTAPTVLPFAYPEVPSEQINELIRLSRMAIPILLFSGVVILGNSVLNANGHVMLTGTAQLVVPVVAITGLLVFGESFGATAVIIGMVVGQLLNLMIIQLYLKKQNISLMPRLRSSCRTTSQLLAKQYTPLAVSAFFVNIAATISTLLAMHLPGGAVASFNLGNKVVLFVTGLVGTTVSTVMLPYFSSLVARNHLVSARSELSFFLILSTFVSVPVSTILYVLSNNIVFILLGEKTFDSHSAEEMVRVMQYSLIQLPFFVSNVILLKFATATKHVMAICFSALFGLLVNFVAAMTFVKILGVGGIALGMSISVFLSTVLLVVILVIYRHIAFFDAVIMLLNWALFITLLVSVHFHSLPGVFSILFAYTVLFVGYIQQIRSTNNRYTTIN